ncbi:MAG: hypothetical protein SGJ19_19595 [Planctomycetia bacterium]|nr:hypothetical protein [Planctomycetia bacterium]
MARRSFTPEELDALFSCPDFVQRSMASESEDPTELFLDASEQQVEEWLRVGFEMKRRMNDDLDRTREQQNVKCQASGLSDKKRWWQFWK